MFARRASPSHPLVKGTRRFIDKIFTTSDTTCFHSCVHTYARVEQTKISVESYDLARPEQRLAAAAFYALSRFSTIGVTFRSAPPRSPLQKARPFSALYPSRSRSVHFHLA